MILAVKCQINASLQWFKFIPSGASLKSMEIIFSLYTVVTHLQPVDTLTHLPAYTLLR